MLDRVHQPRYLSEPFPFCMLLFAVGMLEADMGFPMVVEHFLEHVSPSVSMSSSCRSNDVRSSCRHIHY